MSTDESPSLDQSMMHNSPGSIRSSSSFKRFLAVMVAIWVFIQVVTLVKNYQLYLLYEEPIHWGRLVTPRVLSFVIGLLFIATVWKTSHFFIQKRLGFAKSALLHIVMAFVLSFITFSLLSFFHNIFQLKDFAVESIFKFYMMEMDRLLLIYLLFASFVYAYEFIEGYRLKRKALYHVQKEQVYSHAKSLTQEIDPHIMSNYLSGINALIEHSPKQASEMIKALAKWTRGHIERENIWVTLQDELDFTSDYIAMEKIRFGDQLKIQMNVPVECRSCLIPQKTLQPILENGIKHSQKNRSQKPIRINLHCHIQNQQLVVVIENEGRLSYAPAVPSSRRCIGLSNVKERLQLLYPSQHEFNLYQHPHLRKVICEIKVPIRYADLSQSA